LEINLGKILTKSVKDEILKILNESEKIPTGGLLISGTWGSGKTFFWDKEIAPLIEGEKTPRVSLAGLSNTESVYKAIVTARYIHSIESFSYKKWKENLKLIWSIKLSFIKDWFIGKKAFFIGVIKNAGLDHSQFDLAKTLLRSIPWSELIPQETIVCLDDVERKSISSLDLLGLVIYLSENKNCKIVLIANEKMLDDDFKQHREKMIWRTFYPKAEIEKIFNSFVEKYSSAVHIDAIKQCSGSIVTPFIRGETNLRVLARCIQDVDSIFDAAKNIVPEKFIRFYCSLKVWQAERNGELLERRDYSLLSWYAISESEKSGKELTPSEKEGRAFREKFWDSKEEISESDSLFEFAKSNLLDVSKIFGEFGPSEEISRVRILLNDLRNQDWFFFNDSQNLIKLSEIESILESDSVTDPNVYLIIARDSFRICKHIATPFPETLFNLIITKLENLAMKGISLEDLDTIDARTEEEVEFLKMFTKKYKLLLNEFIGNIIKKEILQRIDNGVEFNLLRDIKEEYQLTVPVADALTSKEVLDSLVRIEKKYPAVYYSFFYRAVKKIRDIPNIEHSQYILSLRMIIQNMDEGDVSSKKRKEFLLKLFD
jgi:hypothetical protein